MQVIMEFSWHQKTFTIYRPYTKKKNKKDGSKNYFIKISWYINLHNGKWTIGTDKTTNKFETFIFILDFKLPPCSKCCLIFLVNSTAFEFCIPNFRNTPLVPSSQAGTNIEQTECSKSCHIKYKRQGITQKISYNFFYIMAHSFKFKLSSSECVKKITII